MTSSLPSIAVFDSGIGGHNVYHKLSQLLPKHNILYLSDSDHVPYGDLSSEQIKTCFLNSLQRLKSYPIQLLVVACYTVSTLSISTPYPTITVLDAALNLLQMKSSKRLAIMGTQSTIKSGKITTPSPSTELFPIACPELVPLIEHNDHHLAEQRVKYYGELFKSMEIDSVLLACTHYSHLLPLMQRHWSSQIDIIDASETCALQVGEYVNSLVLKS